MISLRDQRIWDIAQGKAVPDTIDDSAAGENPKIETNFKNLISITPPAEAQQKFTLAEGYAINLFASEAEFPDLQNPVAFAFDNRGRLWVTTMPSYPQYLPGVPPNDKILIFEDTDADGRADKQTVFADKLYLPAGLEFWKGGAIVAQQPNLLFLKDTNGDDVADVRETILHGFDSADSHHAISAFTFDQGGTLYFEEGTFHHTQVETPYGPERCVNAGVFRYEPRTDKLDVYISYSFANPWGHIFDRWGQNFVADASGGANYFAAAFSGDVDYPHKHGGLKQFLTKQWRPTCGCELVSSRNFPDDAQGNYLLNNCIGFQGTLQYKMKDEGAGFAADPVDPLVQSSDPSYRPVDIEFAPDGSLFLCDWFNPLVGHMQHSIRDPNRDQTHGRIWRVHYTKKPLVTPAKIAGEPIPALLDLLKTVPEERTRYRARNELWNRPTADVIGEAGKWLAAQEQSDPELEHHKLEVLWLHQAHDAVNEPLLKELLRSPDYRARAAATRVLCYWRDRVGEPLELLRAQVNDEHPRVRLEGVRALSFFDNQAAIDVAVESLLYDQDDYLKYTLQETMNTLERRVKK
jgi:glucose/arabinose dehydrogenase